MDVKFYMTYLAKWAPFSKYEEYAGVGHEALLEMSGCRKVDPPMEVSLVQLQADGESHRSNILPILPLAQQLPKNNAVLKYSKQMHKFDNACLHLWKLGVGRHVYRSTGNRIIYFKITLKAKTFSILT